MSILVCDSESLLTKLCPTSEAFINPNMFMYMQYEKYSNIGKDCGIKSD